MRGNENKLLQHGNALMTFLGKFIHSALEVTLKMGNGAIAMTLNHFLDLQIL